HGLPELADKAVLLVDDGIATGATTEAAVLAGKKKRAPPGLVAGAGAPPSATGRPPKHAAAGRRLLSEAKFEAVGQYYASFEQTTDEEVLDVLHRTGTVER